MPRTISVSFEFFPPKNPESEKRFWHNVTLLETLRPEFVSVTYGAGGSTRDNTLEIVKKLRQETSLQPAAHITCVGASKAEINAMARQYWDSGITRLVALRGDPPDMQRTYTPAPQGYAYAHELVRGLKEIAHFDISVAAFPEVHPEARSAEADLDYLKRKIEAGANRAITQYCFDTDTILRFIEKARKKGITVPIVPGIITIGNITQVVNFSQRCGAKIPAWLLKQFEQVEPGSKRAIEVAASIAAEQIKTLYQSGIKEYHIYTLNRADITMALYKQLPLLTS